MKEYDFELKFSLPSPDADPEQFVNALYEAGCDDATVGLGLKGRVALSFTREAPSAQDAVASAIADVTKAIPGAKMIEATPDYVGVTDIAGFVGCSRQNIRKILIENSLAPTPVHSGTTVIWHLANVLDWLKHKGSFKIEDQLIEMSFVTMKVNVEKEVAHVARIGRNPITGATIKIKSTKRQQSPSKQAQA
ncbi:regulatory protein [Sideroxydans lithotrophicus]|uniref:Prophage CP4-57 regulatory n=1 Tax=Sideroxydans lithotrophicus (strain ES-1) TaxID=580332 RepID=D5CQZ2_SIDLE|nr:regulatory protein [Sideroxydans lithotrophicus]ADE11378.1 prophage CP4-57 regulatory [Sideroxydans lithotrophicus ES-1]